MNPNVEITIEQLVLHGFPTRDRQRIALALQRELTRRFTEQGVPASLTTPLTIHRLDAGEFRTSADVRAEVVGASAALAIYREIRQ